MAKNTAKQTESTALATTSIDALSSVLDDLDLDTDGLEEVDNGDIKIPAKVFNMKGTDKNGDPIPANVFYDTVTEETTRALECQLLTLVKSNEFRTYDEVKKESTTHCRSFDRITGTTDAGKERPCQGCPDAQWRTEGGKKTRNCGTVYSLAATDHEGLPFLLRLKKTAVNPFKTYMNRYFIGKRISAAGKRGNYPLFAFKTRVHLKMVDGGKYAVPEFELGAPCSREEILAGQENAVFYREVMVPALMQAAEREHDDAVDGGGAGGDSSFNPADFNDDDAATAAPNSF